MIQLKSDQPEEKVKKSILDILEKTKLLSMATIGGVPNKPTSWINTGFFGYNENMELFILTSPDSIHGKNLQANPSIAVAVFDSHQKPGTQRQGLQISGECRMLTGEEELKALEIWHTRMIGDGKYGEFRLKYAKFASRMHKVTINAVKIFDEPTFGNEVWVDVTVLRS